MTPERGARRRAPALRQRRAGQGRLPRVVGRARDRHAGAGPPLRAAQPAQVPVLHRRRPADAGARHRRQHRDLQRRPRRAAAAAAVRQRRSARRSPAAGAEDRRRERRRLGEGDRPTTARRPTRSTPWSSTTRCRSTCSAAARRRASRPASCRANFFDVLGVTPILGRTFRADDDSKNAPAVLVLSYAYWQNALGGDPGIVGRTFELNDRIHTVVGVLPPIPQFPQSDPPDDVYMPPSACPFRSNPQTIENRNARMLTAIGRLQAGRDAASGRRAISTVVSSRLERGIPRGVQHRAHRLPDAGAVGARRADAAGAPDAARAAGDHRLRPAARLRQHRQPRAGARHRPRARARAAQRARRRPRTDRAPAADREHAARARRRRARASSSAGWSAICSSPSPPASRRARRRSRSTASCSPSRSASRCSPACCSACCRRSRGAPTRRCRMPATAPSAAGGSARATR